MCGGGAARCVTYWLAATRGIPDSLSQSSGYMFRAPLLILVWSVFLAIAMDKNMEVSISMVRDVMKQRGM